MIRRFTLTCIRILPPKHQQSKIRWCKWFCSHKMSSWYNCFFLEKKLMEPNSTNRYLATTNKEANANYLGPASWEEIAKLCPVQLKSFIVLEMKLVNFHESVLCSGKSTLL
ncbi:hypothetical protein BRADI_2g26045v3 [Brachypodium distachyon]|uniref:Uncharacterized protein n=1 Tax=Brachypodium distachyon TaxID=15368 RepID=A0A0Q3MQ40_BRADI|nr:hypothetical protein BRADI_2g26045v3 [Brachypodium distachyon]